MTPPPDPTLSELADEAGKEEDVVVEGGGGEEEEEWSEDGDGEGDGDRDRDENDEEEEEEEEEDVPVFKGSAVKRHENSYDALTGEPVSLAGRGYMSSDTVTGATPTPTPTGKKGEEKEKDNAKVHWEAGVEPEGGSGVDPKANGAAMREARTMSGPESSPKRPSLNDFMKSVPSGAGAGMMTPPNRPPPPE